MIKNNSFIFANKFVCCLFLFSSSLNARQCLDAKKGESQVKYIKVLSERCSGSYYTETLIRENTIGLISIGPVGFGLKHFDPWVGYENYYYGPISDCSYAGSEDVLFIILFRNPYDWLRSIKRTPFLASPEIEYCDFSSFIRTQWCLNSEDPNVKEWTAFHPLIDRDPETGLFFKNVIELRTAKIKNMLEIRKKVKNYYVINYENSRDFPQEVIKEVAEFFDLKLKPEFVPILTVRGFESGDTYVPIQYPSISEVDLVYINEHLNSNLENSIGYFLKSIVD